MLYSFVQNDVNYEKEFLKRKLYFLFVVNLITLASETKAKYAFFAMLLFFSLFFKL